MARILKYIFTILSATYFLFAGTGYNIVKYCCKGCERPKTAMIEHRCCNRIHQPKDDNCCENKKQKHAADGACQGLNRHSEKCFFMRVNVDVPLVEAIGLTDIPSVKCVDLLCSSTLKLDANQEMAYQIVHPPPDYSIPVTGREILALKAVLII